MKINRPAFILGFNAVILQMAFLREWLCLFMGNELILGIYLGAWMLFTGLGSLCSSLPPIGKTDSGKACLATWTGLAILPIPALLLLRWLGVQGRVPGEIPGLFLLLPALLILMFPCFLLGLQFAFLGRAVGGGGAALSSSEAVRRVYLLESLGFALGGFSFTILGLLCVQPVPILFVWTALNAAFIALEFSRGLPRLIYTAVIVILAALGGGAALNLQKTADGLQWKGFNLVSTVESPYGRIAVSRNEREVNIFQNGIYLSGSGEAPSNEESAHLVLLAHRSPGKVLVLGGGGGLLAEILKQPVREAVYLQSDPFLLRTEERYLSGPAKELYSSSRARLFSGDARLFVRRPGEVFDLIFCVLPPPSNILLNRFYTVEFYRDLRDRLAPGGMAAVVVESAEGYIGPELAARNGCILDTLSAVFPSIRVIPGWKAIFLASTDSLRLDPETLVERAGERKIELHFLSQGLIRHRFSPFQMEAFLRSLGGRGWRAVNTDARPLCFFFDLLFWFSRQGISLEQPLKFLKALSLDFPPASFAVLSAVLMLILILGVLKTGKRSSSVLLTTWIMGFSAMALEIFIFTAFQAAYGYIYLQAGVLSAIFMAGSALGSARSFRNPDKTLRVSVLGMASLALILFLYSTVPAIWVEGFNLPEVLIQVFFALAMLLDGVFIGLFFPAANRLSLEDEPPGEGHPGRIYGWDLFGSGFGALFVATIVIPLGGLPAGGGMVGIMLLAGLLMRAIPRRPAPRR
jgi:spermidine synthase